MIIFKHYVNYKGSIILVRHLESFACTGPVTSAVPLLREIMKNS